MSAMAMKIKAVDPGTEKYGIRITHDDGKIGWIAGPDCDYLLFDSEHDALKALRRMLRDDRYSWNCVVEVARFQG